MDTGINAPRWQGGFGCIIFAALERSLGFDTCPNNDNRIALVFNYLRRRNIYVMLNFISRLSGDYCKRGRSQNGCREHSKIVTPGKGSNSTE